VWHAAAGGDTSAVVGVWGFLAVFATAVGGIVVAYLSGRRRPTDTPSRRVRLRQTAQDAIKEYHDTFVKPLHHDNAYLRERLVAERARADDYQQRWDDCERKRIGGAP
jgi:hypothetical protein